MARRVFSTGTQVLNVEYWMFMLKKSDVAVVCRKMEANSETYKNIILSWSYAFTSMNDRFYSPERRKESTNGWPIAPVSESCDAKWEVYTTKKEANKAFKNLTWWYKVIYRKRVSCLKKKPPYHNTRTRCAIFTGLWYECFYAARAPVFARHFLEWRFKEDLVVKLFPQLPHLWSFLFKWELMWSDWN